MEGLVGRVCWGLRERVEMSVEEVSGEAERSDRGGVDSPVMLERVSERVGWLSGTAFGLFESSFRGLVVEPFVSGWSFATPSRLRAPGLLSVCDELADSSEGRPFLRLDRCLFRLFSKSRNSRSLMALKADISSSSCSRLCRSSSLVSSTSLGNWFGDGLLLDMTTLLLMDWAALRYMFPPMCIR